MPARFPDDEKTCKALCPAAEATLFAYRNPGEDMNQAVSISGQPYTSSPNAFRFRQEFNPSCSCKAAGQTWSDALKNIDDKAAAEQQGDIIVTEDSAKKMSRPLPTKAARRPAKKGAAGTTATAHRRSGAGRLRRLRPLQPARDRRQDPHRRPDLHPRALGVSIPRTLRPIRWLARDTSLSSGLGNGLPASRKRLVMG